MKMRTNMKKLNLNELEQVNGGEAPYLSDLINGAPIEIPGWEDSFTEVKKLLKKLFGDK